MLASESCVYMQYFGMKEKPFKCSPNPEYIYLSTAHHKALSLIIYAISSGEGFTAVTGGAGTGKSTLINVLLANLDGQYSAARILNPQMDSVGLLKAINFEFGLSSDTNDSFCLMDELNRFLIRQKVENKKTFLIIDEAQGLNETVLEQLRLLSNLETSSSKLLHIILVGTLDLMQKINSQAMQNLNQRIGVLIHLKPMSARDTHDYICHRLKAAAAENRIQFTRMAFRHIYLKTHGIARLVNRLCDVSLMGAYSKQCTKITAKMVARADQEITRQRNCGAKTRVIFPGRRAFGTALIGTAICSSILAAVYIGGTYLQSRQSFAIIAPSAETTLAADLPMPARPAQTAQTGQQRVETYKVADSGPQQGSVNTAEKITEPSDTPIKTVAPNLLKAQVLSTGPQTETLQKTGNMEARNKASDADAKQDFTVDADKAPKMTHSESLKNQNVSDLIRTIMIQTAPRSRKPVPSPLLRKMRLSID